MTGDLALEFNAPPVAPRGAVVEGNVLLACVAMDRDEARQRFAPIAAGVLGRRVAVLVKAGRYLAPQDPAAQHRSKPVIYGLEDGPKVVTH